MKRGFTLIECVAYMAALALIMGLAYMAFYRYLDYSRGLRRNLEDISRTLKVGERWRSDVRRATGPLSLETETGLEALHIPQAGGEIVYLFTPAHDLWRLAGDAPGALPVLEKLSSSAMLKDSRSNIIAWRWEVELNRGRPEAPIQPLFSFTAVAGTGKRPAHDKGYLKSGRTNLDPLPLPGNPRD